MDLTANQIEDWRRKIKNKIWSEFCAEPNEAHGTKLMKDFDALCDMALRASAEGEPTGWKTVPLQITLDMEWAARSVRITDWNADADGKPLHIAEVSAQDIWEAMWDAAPNCPAPSGYVLKRLTQRQLDAAICAINAMLAGEDHAGDWPADVRRADLEGALGKLLAAPAAGEGAGK